MYIFTEFFTQTETTPKILMLVSPLITRAGSSKERMYHASTQQRIPGKNCLNNKI